MRCEPYDYNNQEQLIELIEWCQNKNWSSMAIWLILYTWMYIWHIHLEMLVEDKYANEFA